MTRKRIYQFRQGEAEGRAEWRDLLGGKGANLAEMANLGIPVPPGFTITTESCVDYLREGRVPEGLSAEVRTAVAQLERITGRGFGSAQDPLLVSVRSGARSSMPGMMDTILDLGLNDQTVEALAQHSSSERFAFDAYRRLLAMFGDVVLGVDHGLFRDSLHRARLAYASEAGLQVRDEPEELARIVPDSVLTARHLRDVVAGYKALLARQSTEPFPTDPYRQLDMAIEAVFRSWNTPRAKFYRKLHGIPDDWGTAVNVQVMVFGNLGETSATGVAFTRDPSTGERRFFGEWLPNAQGEDVVAGIRTPRPLAATGDAGDASLERAMPESYRELHEIQARLEAHFRDMQDLEFTIEAGKLYLLQTRNGKRSARASVRIAVEMVREGLLHPDEAIMRVDADRLQDLLFPCVDPRSDARPVASGLPASPGAVSGKVVFSAEEAEQRAERGEHVILVRVETSPEDLHGMKAARGILTARGGATSHAAVVARGMGRPCVAGCSALGVDDDAGLLQIHAPDGAIRCEIKRGEVITIDGSSGHVYEGQVPTVEGSLGEHMQQLLLWSEKVRRLGVRANADTPEQVRQALEFGAEGVGLCRTEHMFFDEERIAAVREMILANGVEARRRAIAKLLPFQTRDFFEMFRIMEGRPVTVRLLDPPLHEFLPREPEQIADLARTLGVSPQDVERRVEELSEFNPMLGHRGVRLAISFPEIPEMQVRAILSAACRVKKEGLAVHPEIMIPLAFGVAELQQMRQVVDAVKREVFAQEGCEVAFEFGTMIELPRAALLAHEMAEVAEFFSFGTNDLTQTTLGLSRDDSGSFLPTYLQHGVLHDDPFVTLDQEGVGALVRTACDRGRRVRPEISLGLCGEHGGDPRSIDFCERVGLSYVSCSPFRVPIARIAAAQAALRKVSIRPA